MKKILIFSLVLVSFTACSITGESYLEKKIENLEERIEDLEADNSTLKFHLGISESQIEALRDKEAEEKALLEESGTDDENMEENDEDNLEDVEDTDNNDSDDEDSKSIHSLGILTPENNASISYDPIEFTGEVSEGATKITVVATGIDFKDEYELKNFKEGDDSFWYKASRQFDNLAKGENNYEFIVDFNDGETINHTVTIFFE